MRLSPSLRRAAFCAALAAASSSIVACSGQTSPTPQPGGSCSTPAECPPSTTDLSGTWDVVGMSSGGTPEMGTISIASNVFLLKIGGAELSYTAQGGSMTVAYTPVPSNTALAITTTRNPMAFSGGILPLDLGGAWSFSQAGTSCAVNVGGQEINGTCNGPVGGEWPRILARPQGGITYVAHKTASGTSQFGDLSGTWSLYESDDTTPAGTVTFMGSTMSAQGVAMDDGSASLTFNGDGDASGSTSSGIEYSAHRR